jgi:hypothetical protein
MVLLFWILVYDALYPSKFRRNRSFRIQGKLLIASVSVSVVLKKMSLVNGTHTAVFSVCFMCFKSYAWGAMQLLAHRLLHATQYKAHTLVPVRFHSQFNKISTRHTVRLHTVIRYLFVVISERVTLRRMNYIKSCVKVLSKQVST